MEIFSSQKKMDEYKDIFSELTALTDGETNLESHICEEIGRTLLKFNDDAHKSDMLNMCESLQF